MDPDANLVEQRELAAKLVEADETSPGFAEDARRLAELVEALDEWISRGGFLPARWNPNSTRDPRLV